MKTLLTILASLLLALPACTKKGKGDASPDGLQRALKDITTFKVELKNKSSEQLITSFVPSENLHKFGGYDYYYKCMANDAIIEELHLRGKEAIDALRMHVKDNASIFEAINGPPGQTVGRVCKELLEEVNRGAEQSAPPDASEPRR